MEWAVPQLGAIDILVNAAGINIARRDGRHGSVRMGSGAGDQRHGRLQQDALRVTRHASARDGLIINISSIAGKRALTLGGIAYCASKFAMTALGTAVGNEVAAEGVRVTNIYPGEVNTPILENRPVPVSDERKAAMVQPEDFAELVVAIACLHPRPMSRKSRSSRPYRSSVDPFGSRWCRGTLPIEFAPAAWANRRT